MQIAKIPKATQNKIDVLKKYYKEKTNSKTVEKAIDEAYKIQNYININKL